MDSQPPPLKKRKGEQLQETVVDIFIGKKLRCLKEHLLKECGFNSAHRGIWMGNEVGVRRVRIENCHENWLTIVNKHQDKSLRHENVLNVFGFENDNLGQLR